MNRIGCVAVIAACVLGCGGEGSPDATVGDVPTSDVPVGSDPEATPVGTATGNPATATIGAAGGSVESGDGRLQVVFPAGALAQDTPIAIHPLTNEAHGGVGAAWRLDAGGATFAKPVTLVFRHTAEDLDGTGAGALSLAWQGPDGGWYRLSDATVDAAAGTVTATTTHFSDYAAVTGFALFPRSARVRAGEPQDFVIHFCKPVSDSDCGDPNLCPHPLGRLSKCDPRFVPSDVTWDVDGVPGGNAVAGTVAGDEMGLLGTYQAPSEPPVGKVKVGVGFEYEGEAYHLSSPVEVYIPYQGTIDVVGPDWTFHADVSTIGNGPALDLELVQGTTTFTNPKLVPMNDHPDNQFQGSIVVSQDPPSIFLAMSFQRFWDCPTCEPNIPALNFLLVWHQTYDGACQDHFVPVSDWNRLQGQITSDCKAPFAEDPLQLTLSWDLEKAVH